MHIAIYGVLAATPLHARVTGGALARLKQHLKLQRDLLHFKRSKAPALDYRDYGGAHAYNVGDVAIAETIRQLLLRQAGDCTFSNANWGDIESLREINQRNRIDLIVIAGSGYFQFNHEGELAEHLSRDQAFFSDTGIPYAFFGVGINQPFKQGVKEAGLEASAASTGLLRSLLDGARLITVRDDYSASFFSSHTDKAIHMIGDPALHVAAMLGLEPRSKTEVAATPLIGLNFSFHGPTSNKLLLENLAAYAQALLEIRQRTGCRFRYIVHHGSEYPIPHFLRAYGVPVETVHADMTTTASAYRELDLHIGGMLHSCILAASSGTPWIAIAYDIKHRGFNLSMGMENYYMDAPGFDRNKLPQLVLQSLEQNQSLRESIRQHRAELYQKAIVAAASLVATGN